MKTALLFTTLTLTSLIHAGECERFNISSANLLENKKIELIPEEILAHYQQTEKKDIDVIGDFSLFYKAKATPKKILWTLIGNEEKQAAFGSKIDSGKSCAKELFANIYTDRDMQGLKTEKLKRIKDLEIVLKSKLSDDKKAFLTAKIKEQNFYLEGHTNPIKTNEFIEMINQIIIEESANGIVPSFGTPHEWSEDFKKSKTARFSLMAKFPKILLALSRGETSQYLITGQEKQLENWIMSQEDHSVLPHEMIRTSYRLNNGDMYSSILTIENVLNRYWRFEDRANLPITLKLHTIINSFGNDGDIFGAWYHLFGMMLYGYVDGSVPSKTIGTIETIGSHILGKFEDEKQEDFINSKGGVIGGRLARSIKKEKYKTMESNPNRLSTEFYLNLNEDFTDRLE